MEALDEAVTRVAMIGTVANPAAGATITNGATTYSGNFEAALVRFRF